jgi:hypothetical protein
MPTGYTAAIKDGITFQQYALGCARAFGALLDMRDSPINAPIPEQFEPGTYHTEALAKAEARLTQLLEHTSAEDAEREATVDYEEALASNRTWIEKSDALQAQYEAMLVEVDRYRPPTLEHVGFKEFMQDQIRKSIKGDCGTDWLTEPVQLSGSQWLGREIAAADSAVAYHTRYDQEEIKRVEQQNQWIAALRESLKEED